MRSSGIRAAAARCAAAQLASMRTMFLLHLACVAAFAPARCHTRRPSLLRAERLEGEAKKAMSEVRAAMGSTYSFGDWNRVRADFPALSELSDEELRAAVVAGGDPIDILVKTPLLPVFGINIALIAARSQGILLCGTFLADRSCEAL